MKSLINRFAKNGSGSTALEYGLIAAVMSGAIIAGFPFLRDAVQQLYLIVSATVPGVAG